MFHKRLIALAAMALLAACNGDAPQQEGGAASGEVLPGSVSDEMLPYDTVTSQPPLMAPEPAAAASGAAASAVDGDTPVANDADAAATPTAPAAEEPAEPAEAE